MTKTNIANMRMKRIQCLNIADLQPLPMFPVETSPLLIHESKGLQRKLQLLVYSSFHLKKRGILNFVFFCVLVHFKVLLRHVNRFQ